MTKLEPVSELDMEELLDRAREVRPVSPLVRARVVSRARASSKLPFHPVEAPTAANTPFPTRALVGVAFALGVAGAAFAFSERWHERQIDAPSVASTSGVKAAASAVPQLPVPSAPNSEAPIAAPAPEPTASELPRLPRAGSLQANYAAELELMRQAHSAYAQGNFGTALGLVGKHARTFPRGLLAEEREALRVRSLAGAGRNAEARRAATAFAARFPRSVLLTRIQDFAATNTEPNR